MARAADPDNNVKQQHGIMLSNSSFRLLACCVALHLHPYLLDAIREVVQTPATLTKITEKPAVFSVFSKRGAVSAHLRILLHLLFFFFNTQL